jgi:hypothetical protein
MERKTIVNAKTHNFFVILPPFYKCFGSAYPEYLGCQIPFYSGGEPSKERVPPTHLPRKDTGDDHHQQAWTAWNHHIAHHIVRRIMSRH